MLLPLGVNSVDRTDEIGMVSDKIDVIRFGGTVFQAIVNFFGVVGIGKTFLLGQIYQRSQEKGGLVVPIDLAKDSYQKPMEVGRLAMLEDIVAAITPDTKTVPRQFRQESVRLTELLRQELDEDGNLKEDEISRHRREEQMNAVESAFVAFVTRWLSQTEKFPLVLLFDNTDWTKPQFLDWLEEAVVSQLVRTDRVLAVFAGRSPVRWKRFEVRRRVSQHRLQPFGIEQTRKQINKYEVLSDKIIRLTFGHPFGNTKVVEGVQEIESREQTQVTVANFDDYRTRFIEELVEVLIEEHIMRGVPSELKYAFRIISVLRQFDVNALRVILSKFLPSQFKAKGGGYYLSMVARMVETALVEWDSAKKGYALDSTVRRMLALYLQSKDLPKYLEINQAAIALYEDWIGRIAENRSGFVVERIYHRSNVLKGEGKGDEEIGMELGKELEGYLAEFYGREEDTAAVMGLFEELRHDREIDGNIPRGLPILVETVDRFIGRAR